MRRSPHAKFTFAYAAAGEDMNHSNEHEGIAMTNEANAELQKAEKAGVPMGPEQTRPGPGLLAIRSTYSRTITRSRSSRTCRA